MPKFGTSEYVLYQDSPITKIKTILVSSVPGTFNTLQQLKFKSVQKYSMNISSVDVNKTVNTHASCNGHSQVPGSAPGRHWFWPET